VRFSIVFVIPQEGGLMLAIAYHFHVLPRHRDTFRHAWQAARDALTHTVGLRAHDFAEPRDRRDAFTLRLAWDDQTSFERFTRTWIGVWMLNGMGLARDAFARPIETHIDKAESALQTGKHAACPTHGKIHSAAS